MNTNTKKSENFRRQPQTVIDHGRLPPQALEMEDAILGALMLEATAVDNVINLVRPEYFYRPNNRIIFEAIAQLFHESQPIDILTVINKLRELGKLEEVGGAYYISQLTNRIASTANTEHYTQIVVQNYLKRELIRIAANITRNAYDETVDVFEIVEELSTATDNMLGNFYANEAIDACSLYVKTVKQISQGLKDMEAFRENKANSPFVISGLDALDDILGGFHKSRLYVLGARPAMGKSALVKTIAINAARRKKHTLLFSLEMSDVEIMKRVISDETKIQASIINAFRINRDELARIMSAPAENSITKLPLYVDHSSNVSLSHVRAQCQRFKRQGHLDLVIIDYLQLMQSPLGRNANKNDQVGELSKGLKILAKDLDVPIIVLSQLNRAVEGRGNNRPSLSDLRDSGNVEQDADVVMLLWRPDYYGKSEPVPTVKGEINPQGLGFIDVAKQRDGITGTIPLKFIGEFTKFENYEPEILTMAGPATNPDQFIEPNKSFSDIPF